ncbi:MAG: hypothetical protein WD267_03755 [Balneolales bacterium]
MSTENDIKQDIELPDVQLNIVKPKQPIEVPIVENRIATKNASPNFIRHIVFDISGTELEGNVIAGQSIGIVPDILDKDGKYPKLRLYSVASPTNGEDGGGKYISTTVKRLLDEHWENQSIFMGVCSNYLATLKPGSKVKMTGPSGKRFLLPKNPENYNYLFFATGTGIAPFRGMIMDLMEKNVKSEIALIFGCPYRTDLLYSEYLQPLAESRANFHYLKSISREDPRKDGSKHYVQTQIEDESELLHPILKQDNTLIYVCGLKGMETGIYKSLAKYGFKDYLKISEKIAGKDPDDWDKEDLKRNVKPSNRMFLEVY